MDGSERGDGDGLRGVERDGKAPKAADVGESVQFGENLDDYSSILFKVKGITPNVPDTTRLDVDLSGISKSATQIEEALNASSNSYKSKISTKTKLPEEDGKKIANYLFQPDAQLESDIAKQLTTTKLERAGTKQEREMITITKPSEYVESSTGGDAKNSLDDILAATRALGLNRLGDENLKRLSRVRLAYLTGNAYAKALRDFVEAQQSSRDRKEETSRQKTAPGSRGTTPKATAGAGGGDDASGVKKPQLGTLKVPTKMQQMAAAGVKDTAAGSSLDAKNPPAGGQGGSAKDGKDDGTDPAGNPATGTNQDGSAPTQDPPLPPPAAPGQDTKSQLPPDKANPFGRRNSEPIISDVQDIPQGVDVDDYGIPLNIPFGDLTITGDNTVKTKFYKLPTIIQYRVKKGTAYKYFIVGTEKPIFEDGYKDKIKREDTDWRKYLKNPGSAAKITKERPGSAPARMQMPARSDSGISVDGSESEDDIQPIGPRREDPKQTLSSGTRPQSPTKDAVAQDGGAQESSGGGSGARQSGGGSSEVVYGKTQVTKEVVVGGRKEQKEAAFTGKIVEDSGSTSARGARDAANLDAVGAVSSGVRNPEQNKLSPGVNFGESATKALEAQKEKQKLQEERATVTKNQERETTAWGEGNLEQPSTGSRPYIAQPSEPASDSEASDSEEPKMLFKPREQVPNAPQQAQTPTRSAVVRQPIVGPTGGYLPNSGK